MEPKIIWQVFDYLSDTQWQISEIKEDQFIVEKKLTTDDDLWVIHEDDSFDNCLLLLHNQIYLESRMRGN